MEVRDSNTTIALFKKTVASSQARIAIANDETIPGIQAYMMEEIFLSPSGNSGVVPATFKDTGNVTAGQRRHWDNGHLGLKLEVDKGVTGQTPCSS